MGISLDNLLTLNLLSQASVIIVDDHQIVNDLLNVSIQRQGISVMAQCSNGQELLDRLRSGEKPDIVLLDLSMPVMDGSQAFDLVKSEFPTQKIILLTEYLDEFLVSHFLLGGACGYLAKSGQLVHLFEAIRTALKGEVYNQNLPQLLNQSRQLMQHDLLSFTPRKCKIIRAIMDGKSNNDIAMEVCISVKTVELERNEIYPGGKSFKSSAVLKSSEKRGLVFFEKTHGVV